MLFSFSMQLVAAGALIPLLALVGWTLDLPPLESGIPGLTRMNPVTGLCLLALAAGWLQGRSPQLRKSLRWGGLGRSLAFAAAGCAAVRLIQYGFSDRSWLDFALFHDRILNQRFPNRIAPNTALVLTALGLSAATRRRGEPRRFDLSPWLALAGTTFTFAALLGYAYRAASLYRIPQQTPMALNTCLAALLVGTGMLADVDDFCVTRPLFSNGAGGIAARRLLPSALLLPVAMGFFNQLGERQAWFAPDIGEAVFATGSIVLICFVIQRTACRLNEVDAERASHFRSLQAANRQLSEAMERVMDQARELTVAHEVLKIEAVRDPLTGAFNRRHLENLLRFRFGLARSEPGFGLLMIDIDHFKALNDSQGHPAGDVVLQDVARTLIAKVGDGDAVCRYGGEEFAVVVGHRTQRELVECADEIRRAIASLEFSFAGTSVRVTVSIGCALYDDTFSSPEELLREADRALYTAKRSGKNRVVAAKVAAEGEPSVKR
jgi:diguanylate cyclase (GGDEF)-like protein